MKFLRMNKVFFALVISITAALVSVHVCHAQGSKGLPKNSSVEILEDNGQFGLGRIRAEKMGNNATSKVFKSTKGVVPDVNPTVIVYAAYTSDTDGSDRGGSNYLSDTYDAWVPSDSAYFFVAFRVTGKTKVKVSWEIEGPDGENEFEEEIEDSEETGGLLNPDYWYFAWWSPEDALAEGLYDYLATVKPFPKGKRGKGSCQFEVVGD